MNLFLSLFSPNVAYASVDSFIGKADTLIINPAIKLLFAVALVYFLWGVFQFISNADNDEKKTIGKSHMLWGVVGLTIMMGVFAIMNIILSTLNLNKGGATNIVPESGKVKLDTYNPKYPPSSP